MTCNSQPKRINDTSHILSQWHNLSNPGRSFNIPVASKTSTSSSSSNSWLWMRWLLMCKCSPPPLKNLMLSMTLTCLWMPPSVIYLFSFLHTGTQLLLGWLCSFVVILCDNVGLVSLILLGCELRVLYHCTACTRHPDPVSLDYYVLPIFPF